jgi:diacylglycerol kinase (ATP)
MLKALRYSLAGLAAAWRHEAAFRQEVVVGVPLVAFALWRAPDRWQALMLVGSIMLVWLTELLNSAIEALADAVSPHPQVLLGRAKDMASAAVMLSLVLAAATWAAVFVRFP